jgi:2-hydroxycyclohexanecarboxyl-CoA dehydrogenase
MDLGLKDKVAIVTGGGRGIGRQIALTLAGEGVKVAVNDFYEDRAASVAEEIAKANGTAMGVQTDITDFEQAKAMAKKVADKWGRIDILCNNAGNAGIVDPAKAKGILGKFMEMDTNSWAQWINVNFFGVLSCTRAVLEYMVRQNYGKIVNTISDAGRIGESRQSVYSGAKAGVVGFTKAIAKELGANCINVNCVSPGATYTEATLGKFENRSDAQKEGEKNLYRAYPMARGLQRLGLPSDVADMAVFLASDRSQWITGQVISISGGYSMVD